MNGQNLILDVEADLNDIQTALGLTIMKGSIFSKKLRTQPARKNEIETILAQKGSEKVFKSKDNCWSMFYCVAPIKANPLSSELTKKSIRLSPLLIQTPRIAKQRGSTCKSLKVIHSIWDGKKTKLLPRDFGMFGSFVESLMTRIL